ncbi:FKBP-type peptidylprolyl isomerase [uncultured Flavobacterium sp.]|uniref:FKBP-type peptidyl-prolyl cis-trans isomerase n=1 Tax=uncultured Flavobacterium sp. TaxID=165435 RepID=UPI0030CA46EC
MNKFKYYFILLIITLFISSCTKNEVAVILPPRDYNVQYTTDITDIEEYLKNNYITVVDHPGFLDDQDVTISKITDAPNQPSIYSYLNATTFPKLLIHEVKLHDVTNNYKLYYLVLREGVGQSPCNVDGVLAAYKGEYLQKVAATTTVAETITASGFEEVKYPQTILGLYSTILGWSEIFPQFKAGTYTSNLDGTVSHNDFGAGVMFIPSGLAYYGSGSGSIPSYSPLVFSFKLYEIQRLDIDNDGIPSYLEDFDGDGYMRNLAAGVDNPDDTDKDGIPNFLDVDDDGDNYTTKLEIKNPATGLSYPFADIPSCTLGVKNYLDKTCHP